MMVTPHLKTVLKNYQHSAVKSLHGPAHHLHAPFPPPLKALVSPLADDSGCAPAVAPQQLPILTASDTASSDLAFTPLEDVAISCFAVGGEKRLCLPQVLQSVLGDFTLAQINHQCDNLLIYCSRCTHEQLNVLKSRGILPSSAFSCGLITKSDAERLCSALLYNQSNQRKAVVPRKKDASNALPYENAVDTPTKSPLRKAQQRQAASPTVLPKDKSEDITKAKNSTEVPAEFSTAATNAGSVFRVKHECFGRAVGVLHVALYVAKQAKCIECVECRGWHSPQQFVKHVHWTHARGESQTVHWGFDSAKWRHYLLPLRDDDADSECCAGSHADVERVLDLMRDRYDGVVPFAPYEPPDKNKEVKDVNGANAAGKEWNMSLKRKLLHQASKTTTSPPLLPPTPPPIKHEDPSSLLASKKAKLSLSGDDYLLMAAQSYLPPLDTYLPSSAVFQQFSLPFPYPLPHALPLGAGGGHPSAKEAKLRQSIRENNADLGIQASSKSATDEPTLPPTPKKQRLFRHLQEQRRKLEEVQKSPDSTTVVPTAQVAERKYSEIDLSTTDTEDTASEGTQSSEMPKSDVISDTMGGSSDAPVSVSESNNIKVERLDEDPNEENVSDLGKLQDFLSEINLNTSDKQKIVDMFKRLVADCAKKDARIQALEALQQQADVANNCEVSPHPPCNGDTRGTTIKLEDDVTEQAALIVSEQSNNSDRCAETVQIDHKSVITSQAKTTDIIKQEQEAIPTSCDTSTSATQGADEKQHCLSSTTTSLVT